MILQLPVTFAFTMFHYFLLLPLAFPALPVILCLLSIASHCLAYFFSYNAYCPLCLLPPFLLPCLFPFLSYLSLSAYCIFPDLPSLFVVVICIFSFAVVPSVLPLLFPLPLANLGCVCVYVWMVRYSTITPNYNFLTWCWKNMKMEKIFLNTPPYLPTYLPFRFLRIFSPFVCVCVVLLHFAKMDLLYCNLRILGIHTTHTHTQLANSELLRDLSKISPNWWRTCKKLWWE